MTHFFWNKPLQAVDLTSQKSTIESAFVYNLGKFTEWPIGSFSTSPNHALKLCVLGDSSLESTLQEVIQERTIQGHPVIVKRVENEQEGRPCHMLFIRGVSFEEMKKILKSVQSFPVLTVGDDESFSKLNGCVRLFVANDQLKFEVNLKALNRAKLKISSKVLVMAKIYEDADEGVE